MDLTPKQQASEAIRQAEAILIVTGQRPNIDQVASLVALSLILRKFGKKVTAVVTDQVPASANFITEGNLEKSLTGLRDFIMRVDLGHAEVDKLKYTIESGKLNIHVVPFKGGFSQQDVSFSHGDYHYDLIIAMGVPNRSKLDRVFEQNPLLLQSTPLLNVDYHRINEGHGAINLIDTNAATLSEMLISLSESLQAGLLDEQISTAMLTGIIASTDRFTAAHTTAKSMTVAAQLMAGGAKQQQIIKALYGNRDGRDGGRDGRDNRDRDRRPDRTVQPSHHQSTTSAPSQTTQPSVQNQPVVSQPSVQPQPSAQAEAVSQPVSPPQPPMPPASSELGLPNIDWNSVMPSVPTSPLEAPSFEPEASTPQVQPAPSDTSDEGNSGNYASEAHLNPSQA